MTMTSQFSDMTSLSTFWTLFCFLVNFSYWSKFHVNIITGSGIITIFFYKGLTRNPEIRDTSVWVLPNIWRLGRVRNTKPSTNSSDKIVLNAAKCQGYSFYRFWVIKEKPTREGKSIPPPPSQIRVNNERRAWMVCLFFKNIINIIVKYYCFFPFIIWIQTLQSVNFLTLTNFTVIPTNTPRAFHV